MSSLESLVVKWNKDWSWDYMWRKKHNIAFNSKEHKLMSPLDIRLDLLEESMIQDQIKIEDKRVENLKSYKKTGEWWIIDENMPNSKEEDDLFDDFII